MAEEDEPIGEAELIEGLEKKKLSGKKLVIIIGGVVVLLIVGFLVMSMLGGEEEPKKETEADQLDQVAEENKVEEAVVEAEKIEMLFIPLKKNPSDAGSDAEDITVQLDTGGRGSSYISVQISIQVDRASYKAAVEQQMPIIFDELIAYLKQLRPQDVNGSMGTERLKEELMYRFNQALLSPTRIRDVHFLKFVVSG